MSKITITSRSAAIATIILGIIVQISGHLSIFLVGSSMKLVNVEARVSMDKFSYLLDSTASPVASLSLVSSFMAVQTAYIEQEFVRIGYTLYGPFEAFLVSIPQGFYQINVLVICFCVSIFNRDLFLMHQPEIDARNGISAANVPKAKTESDPLRDSDVIKSIDNEIEVDSTVLEVKKNVDPFAPEPGFPRRWFNAVIPFVLLLVISVLSVFLIGLFNSQAMGIQNPSITQVLQNTAAVKGLLWGMTCSTVLLFIQLMIQGKSILSLIETWYEGCNSMLPAMIMLVMAWALSSLVQATHLGVWMGGALASGGFPAGLLPFMVAILSFFVSFATGTSFGTMGVIFPISVPLAYALAPNDGGLMITTIAATIGGANSGDNCSPFSDTTILSAIMSDVPNMQHTKSQFPYSLLALVVSCLLGFLPVGFKAYNEWVANLLQIVVIGFIVIYFGTVTGLYNAKEKQTYNVGGESYFRKTINWVKQKLNRRQPEYI